MIGRLYRQIWREEASTGGESSRLIRNFPNFFPPSFYKIEKATILTESRAYGSFEIPLSGKGTVGRNWSDENLCRVEWPDTISTRKGTPACFIFRGWISRSPFPSFLDGFFLKIYGTTLLQSTSLLSSNNTRQG